MVLVGINNENEFYFNYYLGEVFISDICDVLEFWIVQENVVCEVECVVCEQGKDVELGYCVLWNQFNSLVIEFFCKFVEYEKQCQILQCLVD